jgi:hypothetical protein
MFGPAVTCGTRSIAPRDLLCRAMRSDDIKAGEAQKKRSGFYFNHFQLTRLDL